MISWGVVPVISVHTTHSWHVEILIAQQAAKDTKTTTMTMTMTTAISL